MFHLLRKGYTIFIDDVMKPISLIFVICPRNFGNPNVKPFSSKNPLDRIDYKWPQLIIEYLVNVF